MAKKICLDAGHYGKYNRCPAIPEYYESEMNWKFHLLLKKYLEQYGIEVITTRTNPEKDLGLTARGKASKGCDLFISLHSNAVGNGMNEKVDYPVVYVPLNGSADEIGKKLADCVTQVMGTTQKGYTKTRKGSGNWDYYGVIYGAVQVGTPGIIIEHSFHTNTRSTRWLLEDSNLDKLAKAEAKVIAEHYEMQPLEQEIIYRVQTGAFSKLENARALKNELENMGFDTYLVEVDGLFKVQVGAFIKLANAEAMEAKLKTAGFETYITTRSGTPVSDIVEDALAVGDQVRMTLPDAPVWGKSYGFQPWVYNAVLYVREIDGNCITVSTQKTGDITGSVHRKHLAKV